MNLSRDLNKKVIAISGTPGTGKSTLAIFLKKKLGFDRLDLHQHYKKISSGYQKDKQCYNIQAKKFTQLVKDKIKHCQKGLIIDSHISHLLPKKMLNLCIILTCSDLKQLEKRLKKRKYSTKKIRENLDSEIFQICLSEAKELKQKIIIFDTSKKTSQKQLLLKISKSL